LQIPWTAKKTNEVIFQEIKEPQRLSKIARILRYFETTKIKIRRDENNLERLIVQGQKVQDPKVGPQHAGLTKKKHSLITGNQAASGTYRNSWPRNQLIEVALTTSLLKENEEEGGRNGWLHISD